MSDPRITDEAVDAAATALSASFRDNWPALDLAARAALEAALPLLAPQPVVDRDELVKALRAELVLQGVDEFHDPAPLGRHLADAVLALLNGTAK